MADTMDSKGRRIGNDALVSCKFGEHLTVSYYGIDGHTLRPGAVMISYVNAERSL